MLRKNQTGLPGFRHLRTVPPAHHLTQTTRCVLTVLRRKMGNRNREIQFGSIGRPACLDMYGLQLCQQFRPALFGDAVGRLPEILQRRTSKPCTLHRFPVRGIQRDPAFGCPASQRVDADINPIPAKRETFQFPMAHFGQAETKIVIRFRQQDGRTSEHILHLCLDFIVIKVQHVQAGIPLQQGQHL